MRWSSPVKVIWTRNREAPPQHGGVREAGSPRQCARLPAAGTTPTRKETTTHSHLSTAMQDRGPVAQR